MKSKGKSLWTIILLSTLLVIVPDLTTIGQVQTIPENELRFVFFSLPDGEAMFIQTGRDKNILIDTGSKLSEKSLLKQLNQLHVQHIDQLIITNQTLNHCGNTTRLVERYNISEVVFSGKLQSICLKDQVPSLTKVTWKQGDLHEPSPGLFVRVLPSLENSEMSLFMIYGKTSLLYLASGDIRSEKSLIADYPINAEILKVGGYAQSQSPTTELLEKIDPHVAIIYTLKGISPNEGLLERLNESWIDVYQLKKVGTTSIQCTLKDYEIIN